MLNIMLQHFLGFKYAIHLRGMCVYGQFSPLLPCGWYNYLCCCFRNWLNTSWRPSSTIRATTSTSRICISGLIRELESEQSWELHFSTCEFQCQSRERHFPSLLLHFPPGLFISGMTFSVAGSAFSIPGSTFPSGVFISETAFSVPGTAFYSPETTNCLTVNWIYNNLRNTRKNLSGLQLQTGNSMWNPQGRKCSTGRETGKQFSKLRQTACKISGGLLFISNEVK